MNDNKLLPVNENSVWYKIRKFFKDLFGQKYKNIDMTQENKDEDLIKQDFINSLKHDEKKNAIKLLKEKYECGEIALEDMKMEDLKAINSMYDSQIDSLIKDITETKKKILLYNNI
ncbi:MAG: hypothetical protein PHH22_02560 [Clostridia bacterium]|nr:hypothetical protein [Clostridia bacterium]